jgi:hypothetical protein
MAEGMDGRFGIARFCALIFGVAYLVLATIEVLFAHRLSDSVGIDFIGMQNALNWVVGVIMMSAFFGTERTARFADRIFGFLFLALTIWGLRSPSSLGNVLGSAGNLPAIYNVIHFVTAIGALFAGFVSRGGRKGTSKSTKASVA